VTGVHPLKHSVLFNGVLVRGGPGEPVRIDGLRDQKDLVAVPTIYDRLHGLGYRTANINWPCTRGSAALDDNFPDVLEQVSQMTPRLRDELVTAGILPDARDATFRALGAAARDKIWTAAAIHVITTRKPNLLLLHLLLTDTIQHRYGPRSEAAYTAMAQADAHVAEVLRAITASGLGERTTVFAVSDHGFSRPSKLVNPNVIFRRAGLMRPRSRTRVQAISEGGVAFVFLTDPSTTKADEARVRELLRGQEGIDRILGSDDFAELGLPEPAKNPQMADLLITAKKGYAFAEEVFDEEVITELKAASGSHGSLASDPEMNGAFVAWGRGIMRGAKLGIVDNRDVAPTIAALLGETMAGVDGKVLHEILTEPAEH
jgi:predicted AlkP superfamily pyrophosphatase or phosphodiesterase